MEWLRKKFTSLIESQFEDYDTHVVKEADILKHQLVESDKRKKITWSEIDITPDKLEFRSSTQRIHSVNQNEKLNLFMNPWKAMYLEKHGKLVRVGAFKHADVDVETPWTRARQSNENIQISL